MHGKQNIKLYGAVVTSIKRECMGKKQGTQLSDCPMYLHRHGISGKIK